MSFSNRIDVFNPTVPISGTLIVGAVQLVAAQTLAPLLLSLYAKTDTGYASPVTTLALTADTNGDATFSFDLGSFVATPGVYILRVTRTSGSPALTAFNSGDITIGAIGTLIAQLRAILPAFDAIERMEEPAMPNAALDTFRFGYGNWTSDSPLLSEEDEADSSAGSTFKIDYVNGTFNYVTALLSGHDVRATYKFNIFTDADYIRFFNRSLAAINGWKPQTSYTFDSAPSQWLDILILGAYIHTLEAVSFKIPTFKFKRVFEDPAMMLGQINAMLLAAKTEFRELLTKIKRRGSVHPLGISSLSAGGMAYQADSVNFRSFAIGG